MRFKLFEEHKIRRALNNKEETDRCPVCGNKGNQIDVNDMGMTHEIYYKCKVCDFEWNAVWNRDYYGDEMDNTYTLDGLFTKEGDRIKVGEVIPSRLYDEMKLIANKYNI